MCSAGDVELPIVLLYLPWCKVYHMLSKTRRNSRSLHRVIVYICCIYFDAWCITCCWGIRAMFADGAVRFHTAVVFFITTVVVVLPVSFSNGFSRCRGYWIWVFCCLFVVCIYWVYICVYMFGWLCRATCSFVSTLMFGISHAVQNEKLWNLHIG